MCILIKSMVVDEQSCNILLVMIVVLYVGCNKKHTLYENAHKKQVSNFLSSIYSFFFFNITNECTMWPYGAKLL